MKIPRSAIHFLVALEAVAMIAVLVLCIIHPVATKTKNDTGSSNSENVNEQNVVQENTENAIDSGIILGEVEVTFSEEVLAKVDEMTLEQKVAQMFIITPEALTDMNQVTVLGNATKNAINQYPVGGLVYSSINFQGKTQTMNMLDGIQEYYTTQFGIPMFLMIEEKGGAETSPLATVDRYNIEASPSDVGATGDTETAITTATNIATYLNEVGFNMNLAPNADLAAGVDVAYDSTTYSSDVSLAAMMVAETVSTYETAGISAVMSMFPGESMGSIMSDTEVSWEQAAGLVYKAGIDAGVDCIMVGNVYAPAFTGDESTPCCMSRHVVRYLRTDMQYGGVLISDSLSEGHITENYTSAEAAVAAIQAGMDMIYCPENFKEAYQGVIDAVNAGTISQDDIDTAVARILTCKEGMENQ